MRSLRGILHTLGPFGIAGLGILLFCAVFYLGEVKPAETGIAVQREAAQRQRARLLRQPVTLDRRSDDLRRFYDLFPATDATAAELQRLWVAASKYQIELLQGEYRLETGGPGLARYQITLPLRATYGQIRSFVNFILKEMPAASIDGLRFERTKISESRLDVQIRLTLYFRPTLTAARP